MASSEQPTGLPRSGRLAGIDFGTVRIGIAICDPGQKFASPLENYTRLTQARDADRFQRLVRDEGLVAFVVGLPVHLSGEESHKSMQAREFGAWLAQVTALPVEFYDERFTSVEAEQFLLAAQLTSKKRKARMDMVAAQIMLTGYLESRAAR